MVEISRILIFMTWIAFSKCQMEPFIVGGNNANIVKFPHSAFMLVNCAQPKKNQKRAWICAGSIVNERIILTAAHCTYECPCKSAYTVSVGHSHRDKGLQSSVLSYYIHEDYIDDLTANDIALVLLKTDLKFGTNIKRIAFMRNPPYYEIAQVAGWGIIDEVKKKTAVNLMFINQYVWKPYACKQVLNTVPKGTICASSGEPNIFSTRGDSGSALVVRGFIQIGIVSYKMPSISKSLVVYTDTGYFYDWIKKNAKKLYCVIEQK